MENIPEYKARAEQIARDFARQNLARKAKVLIDDFQHIDGDHTPMGWRVDGDELIVVLNSGPKIRGKVKAPNIIEKAADAIAALITPEDLDERQKLQDAREEELNRREADLSERESTLAIQTSINLGDGVSDAEASAAGKALQAKKAEKK